jgi:hypothetical protein
MTDITTETVETTDKETGEKSTVERKTEEGSTENAYGRPLKDCKFKDGFTPVENISFLFTYDHLKDFAAIPEKERMSDQDILDAVNADRKQKARQKSAAEAIVNAGVVKPVMADDRELQIASIVKGLLNSKKKRYTPESARARAIFLLEEEAETETTETAPTV